MRSYKIYVVFIFTLVFITGCKNRKPKGDCATALTTLPTDVTDQMQANLADFQDVTIRVKAKYKGGNADQSFGMLMKMKKDSFVWVSISVIIEVARAYITPDSFKLIDRINKKYYLGSIETLEQFIGQKLSLSQLQNLLLANPVYALEGFQKMNDELRSDFLQQTQSGVINRMQVTECFRPNECEFTTGLDNKSVVVDYKNFSNSKDIGNIPSTVSITANDSMKNYHFLMEYTSVSAEPIPAVRFVIPSKYEQGN